MPVNTEPDDLGPTRIRSSLTRRLWHHPELPDDFIARLWTDAERLFACGTLLKSGRRCTLARIEWCGAPMLAKRYNRRGRLHSILHLLSGSRASRSWFYSGQLRSAQIRTPVPLAMLEERLGPCVVRSYFLTEFVAGVTLRKHVRDCRRSSDQIEAYARQFAETWRKLGAHRLIHGDLKTNNFLVSPDGRLWLIDLDSMHWCRWNATRRIERDRDLARFMRDWHDMPDVAAVFKRHVDGHQSTVAQTVQTL